VHKIPTLPSNPQEHGKTNILYQIKSGILSEKDIPETENLIKRKFSSKK
jgi:hypothetical protein